MVTEWDTLLAEEEIVQSTLVFDRYKLRVWRLFTHNWTIFPLQTTATNYGWILRITSVGDLFPVVLGHLLCVWGSCTHIPMEVHNDSVKKKQQDLLLLCECGRLTVFSVKGQRRAMCNFSQLLLTLRKGCVVTYFSPIPPMPQWSCHTGSTSLCRLSLNVSKKNRFTFNTRLCYGATVTFTVGLIHADIVQKTFPLLPLWVELPTSNENLLKTKKKKMHCIILPCKTSNKPNYG